MLAIYKRARRNGKGDDDDDDDEVLHISNMVPALAAAMVHADKDAACGSTQCRCSVAWIFRLSGVRIYAT